MRKHQTEPDGTTAKAFSDLLTARKNQAQVIAARMQGTAVAAEFKAMGESAKRAGLMDQASMVEWNLFDGKVIAACKKNGATMRIVDHKSGNYDS